MLELPTGVNTADIGEFGRENIEQFFDFLSRTVG
jgi:5-methylcytosine-specific restriction enzyme subunit McrC